MQEIHWHQDGKGALEIDDLNVTEARTILKNVAASRIDHRIVPHTGRKVSLQFKSLTRTETAALLEGMIRLPRVTEGRARTVHR